jgi:hypothetical protein
LVTASACSALFLGLFSVQVGWVPAPEGLPLAGSGELSRSKLYTLAVNIVAFYLVGFLAGYLAKRLEEQGDELERRELARGDRPIGDARRDFFQIHDYCLYDFEVDSLIEPERNPVALIAAWQARGRPSAFERLTARREEGRGGSVESQT